MIRRLFGPVLFAAALSAGGLFMALPAAKAQQAPEATTPEAAAVKICSSCHGMQIVTDTPKDYDDWHDTVQKMIDRGARGTPEEFDLVMDFLFQNMTPVDVNHADADSLAAILHTSQDAAQAIIKRREARPFKDLADLEKAVPGLDRAFLDGKTRMIIFKKSSGRLAPALDRASHELQRELDALVGTLVALVEPLVLLVMGGLVLMMVLAILLPIINLNNLVGL